MEEKLASHSGCIQQEKATSKARAKANDKEKASPTPPILASASAPVSTSDQQRDFLDVPILSRNASNPALSASTVHRPSPLSMPVSVSATDYHSPGPSETDVMEQDGSEYMYYQYPPIAENN